MRQFYLILRQRWVLQLLFIINILGTIYGYYWYRWQLVETPFHFLPFVPDSPTASLFFVIVLAGFLYGKHVSLFEALAAMTLFKYGIWAVGMNIGGMIVTDSVTVENWMLIGSHFGMALQGLLYAPFYQIKRSHFIFSAVWTLHNDVIDYVFHMQPRYPSLQDYIPQIGYLTFWLSMLTIFLIYRLTLKRDRLVLNLSDRESHS